MALPNWPKLLSPQHLTPLVVAAQVCHVPSATSLTPLVSPLTSIGMCDSVVVPSPSWPASLAPQHLTPPLVSKAHVCPPPASFSRIAATPVNSPLTFAGVDRSIV